MPIRGICALTLVAAAAAGMPRVVSGQPQVSFDHRSGSELSSYTVDVESGHVFAVRIANTCESEFVYEVLGFGSDEPPPPTTSYSRGAPREGQGLQPRLGSVSIPIRHDESYGGYVIEIRRPDREEASSIGCVEDGQGVDLQPARLVIATPRRVWTTSVSAGFSLSGLVNAACDVEKEAEKDDRCSDARPGLVSFVHVHHARLAWLAPVFGLGLSDGRTEYYIGGGLRLGGAATFNGGLVVGSVQNGFGEDPPTKFNTTWFFGVSYSLLGDDSSAIRAPFAGMGQ